MKRTVFLYGLSLAGLVFLLKYLEYRIIVHELSIEFYIGIVALFFTSLGIWAGLKLTHKNVLVVASGFILNESERQRLGISKRELEVLELMSQGLTNREIGDKLFVSHNTIKTHLSNLFLKLEVSRRTQAIQKAKALRLIP